jgi:transposase
MSAATLFPDPRLVRVCCLRQDRMGITAEVATVAPSTLCPLCGHTSHRVHSRYTRTVADLPWHGIPFRLHLIVRRFFCDHRECPRQIFTERLPELVAPYARRTLALSEVLTLIGFALGGEAGARLLHAHHEGVSPDTLVRLIRRAAVPAAGSPTIVGVDDFAFRRGQRYGTILVDLEQHRVIDLLPDREAATVAQWLAHHPGITLICRDRGGAYAEGARQGAPQVKQVADRFHLLKNLGDALEVVLRREQATLEHVQTTVRRAVPAVIPPETMREPAPVISCMEHRHSLSQTKRQTRYDQIQTLRQQGVSLRAIARYLGVTRNTVRRYVYAVTCPPIVRSPRHRGCETFATALRERWDAGEHNSAALFRAIQAQGYMGSASSVRLFVRAWRSEIRQCPHDATQEATRPGYRPFSAHQTRWVMLQDLNELDDVEQGYRAALCEQAPIIREAGALATAFQQMVRERARDRLGSWLDQVDQSGIAELVSFARGIRRDFAAVVAALEEPWSSGQVEGQVNRVKFIKRSMYGRANFDLLRQRVLGRSAS